MTSRRTLLTGLVGFVACAPAIVRASSIMPVKRLRDLDDDILIMAISHDGVKWHDVGVMIPSGSYIYTTSKPIEVRDTDTLRVTFNRRLAML